VHLSTSLSGLLVRMARPPDAARGARGGGGGRGEEGRTGREVVAPQRLLGGDSHGRSCAPDLLRHDGGGLPAAAARRLRLPGEHPPLCRRARGPCGGRRCLEGSHKEMGIAACRCAPVEAGAAVCCGDGTACASGYRCADRPSFGPACVRARGDREAAPEFIPEAAPGPRPEPVPVLAAAEAPGAAVPLPMGTAGWELRYHLCRAGDLGIISDEPRSISGSEAPTFLPGQARCRCTASRCRLRRRASRSSSRTTPTSGRWDTMRRPRRRSLSSCSTAPGATPTTTFARACRQRRWPGWAAAARSCWRLASWSRRTDHRPPWFGGTAPSRRDAGAAVPRATRARAVTVWPPPRAATSPVHPPVIHEPPTDRPLHRLELCGPAPQDATLPLTLPSRHVSTASRCSTRCWTRSARQRRAAHSHRCAASCSRATRRAARSCSATVELV